MRLSKEMTLPKPTYEFIAQAETLLIYGIFLFLTGLAQIGVTIGHRYVFEQTTNSTAHFTWLNLFPKSWTLLDLHLWYIYPSAALTIIPCLCSIIYAIFKRQWMAILICMSSFISFISSSIYVGLLIIHTLEYWQTISSDRFKITQTGSSSGITSSSKTSLLVSFDEPATFTNLALLITFTLALVQALLSLIGAVISCLWSPCCLSSTENYTPIQTTNSHYCQTTPHRLENPASSTLRSVRRSQGQMETHRFLPSTEGQDPMLNNGFLHQISPIRNNYDEV